MEFIVAPSAWHSSVAYMIVRALREGRRANLRLLSLSATELSLYSPRKPVTDLQPPRRGRRRVLAPVCLHFDLAEVVKPAAPSCSTSQTWW